MRKFLEKLKTVMLSIIMIAIAYFGVRYIYSDIQGKMNRVGETNYDNVQPVDVEPDVVIKLEPVLEAPTMDFGFGEVVEIPVDVYEQLNSVSDDSREINMGEYERVGRYKKWYPDQITGLIKATMMDGKITQTEYRFIIRRGTELIEAENIAENAEAKNELLESLK